MIDSFSYNPTSNKISFKEPTYRKWSAKRIQLGAMKDNFWAKKQLNVHRSYNLDVKIFMDINQIEDSTYVQLATILDPFTSYSNLNKTAVTKAFVNMYFDFVEIKKRQLQRSIQGISAIKQIKECYTLANIELVKSSKSYFTKKK
jgi:hypothetical protein